MMKHLVLFCTIATSFFSYSSERLSDNSREVAEAYCAVQAFVFLKHNPTALNQLDYLKAQLLPVKEQAKILRTHSVSQRDKEKLLKLFLQFAQNNGVEKDFLNWRNENGSRKASGVYCS